ncbi:ATP-dependent RNA helicase DBP5-like [Ornithorhynchus anatinus]|uniref:ATP-dependent RNA helicase DBP5-like n=1 Tax=Ornithorhynchus anatinus TaxID=9258 RepID=UPI0010A7E470|nr:ATP-dependent RNA helicase DBP5-like [Ornithorhynchus anatinus]
MTSPPAAGPEPAPRVPPSPPPIAAPVGSGSSMATDSLGFSGGRRKKPPQSRRIARVGHSPHSVPQKLPFWALSNLHLKEEKPKPEANGAVVKSDNNAEKTEDEEKEDRAAQSLLNKLIRSNLVDNTNQVEVLQRDPNSPLYSVKSFEELRLNPSFCRESTLWASTDHPRSKRMRSP